MEWVELPAPPLAVVARRGSRPMPALRKSGKRLLSILPAGLGYLHPCDIDVDCQGAAFDGARASAPALALRFDRAFVLPRLDSLLGSGFEIARHVDFAGEWPGGDRLQ